MLSLTVRMRTPAKSAHSRRAVHLVVMTGCLLWACGEPAEGALEVDAPILQQADIDQDTAAAGTPAGSATASTALKSAGCGVDPRPQGAATIQVDGLARTYEFSLPTGYDKNRPYPLVFGFHGAGVEVSSFRTYFDMTTVVGADAIVVYPSAPASSRSWSVKRDLPLFDALLAQFEAQYCVDAKHIFAAGHSSGGMMTHALGCQRGNVLRGIGPLSAGPPSGACVGQPAVWISHGNADATVNVSSGRRARDFWASRNHCDVGSSKPVDPAPTVEYASCDAGSAVRYLEYEGSHNLPRYAPKGIWDFFKTL